MRFPLAAGLLVLVALGCNGGASGTATKSSAPAATTPPAPGPGTSTSPATSSTKTAPPPASSGGSGGIAGVTPGTPSFGLLLTPGNALTTFDLYVPTGYSGAPTGVVLCFHGVEGTSTPDGWFQLCVNVCNKDRFIVVAPYGDVNDGGSGAWTQPFAAEILDLVRQKYNVDLKRQYVAAISGGCLPAIFFALGSAPATYTSPVGSYTVRAGFQSDFAAVGFSSPAYSPSAPDFAGMSSQSASSLGSAPALFVDYGELSSNKPQADDLAAFGNAHGYAPVTEVVRPGEGHPPQPPYTFEVQMFDLFAASAKP